MVFLVRPGLPATVASGVAMGIQWLLAWQAWVQLGRPGELVWSASGWLWIHAEASQPLFQPQVRIDLGTHLLICFTGDDEPGAQARWPTNTRWFWLDSGSDSGKWHLLRCAVYSAPPSSLADHGGQIKA